MVCSGDMGVPSEERAREVHKDDRHKTKMTSLLKVGNLLKKVRALAIAYYKETGKPLGVTGEIAEYEAAKLLSLELASAREPGFDAVRKKGVIVERIQIKGRRLVVGSKNSGRVPSINLKKDWDSVMLVLLNDAYQPTAIYEATRRRITTALMAPGSKARNERGALSISKFRAIGKKIWSQKKQE